MDYKVMKKWVAALRSGKYKQTNGQLGRGKLNENCYTVEPKSFCCLGVLCHVLDPKDQNKTYWDDGTLPFWAQEMAGLQTNHGVYTSSTGKSRDLTIDNDMAHRRFKKIADIIEKHWEEL